MDARFVFLSAITERVPLVGYWAGATRESEQGTSNKKKRKASKVSRLSFFKGSESVGGLFLFMQPFENTHALSTYESNWAGAKKVEKKMQVLETERENRK